MASRGQYSTTIRAHKSVYAGYLEHCTVYARESVQANCIVDCHVYCNGPVTAAPVSEPSFPAPSRVPRGFPPR